MFLRDLADSSCSLSCFLLHYVLAGEYVYRVVYNERGSEECSVYSFLSGVISLTLGKFTVWTKYLGLALIPDK
jgi:hypothetical protein